MGVPALFRWLSKKYPKIVSPVVEEEERKFTGEDGGTVTIPINFPAPNPNGVEFDNLYLDMNGIVHPCTHPEGKAAPETEEEMMVEVFKYTERVVNMIRPRKLLMIAIDGVAPRAKMNQQRSRRFRASQEAREKEEARKESLVLWESMGQAVTEEMRNKKSWDSNAITPGTPFMDLLAQSIRYWIVQKMNTDPGWKQLEVIISDASVPGEGEHKIMDFIRRQRSNAGHDPNTQHVIYGLDADLIMLSLATHEPNFRVLREDVFFQDTSPTACRICGQEGHFAAQCTGEKKIKADEHDTKNAPVTKKPFIFLDVSILREYLEIELNISNTPFPFDFERAIDDWVLLIFFVGNDFLPHLPSLEIREGAIDTLLKIWKDELPRMGGYITNHGNLEYARTEIILEGLAKREDEIFRRRREAEERQEQNTKRRKIEAEARKNVPLESLKPAASLQLTGNPSAPPAASNPYGLPPRPNFDSFESSANSLGFGTPAVASANTKAAAMATIAGGSTSDWVDKRREIRMANLSAAEMLKAEMMSAVPVNPTARKQYMARMRSEAAKIDVAEEMLESPAGLVPVKQEEPNTAVKEEGSDMNVDKKEIDTNGTVTSADEQPVVVDQLEEPETVPGDASANGDLSPSGIKRKVDELEDAEGEDDEDSGLGPDDEEEDATATSNALLRKVNADGTVDQDDTVKLWEPGYKERYYKQKFGVEANDLEFRRKITTAYVEGMAWVLAYYYQGTPSWTWYYPFHFAPFAQDFVEVSRMDIKFDKGQPFKPFEQLMGVFPSASRHHIPEVFHSLMTESDSPIIDFYPETFEIDMNGKKMAWQGVALLPFIDEKRLLDAMAPRYEELSDEEERRNKWGSNVLYVADEHPLYPLLESLYAKRKDDKPVPIDPKQGKGLNGTLLPDPSCVPGSTFESPLASQGLDDIVGDCSLAALYFFPKQLIPHRSTLLPGVRPPARVLTRDDSERIRRGDRGRPRGAGFHDINSGRGGGRGPPRNGYNGAQSYGGYNGNGGRDGYGGGGGGGYGGYGGGYNQYGEAPRGRGRGDSDRANYGGSTSHSTYGATPMSEYSRSSSSYYQGGGTNDYNRPPPASSYGNSSGGYGRGRGGYQSNSYNQSSSYSQGYSNNSGYGSNSRDRYGGHVAGNSTYGGYGGDRGGGTSGGYGGYGSGRGGGGGGGGAASQYNQPQGGYGGYGRGAPPPSSNYNTRGRGYGRY